MPVANHPSAAIRKHEFRGRDQKRLELRLDRLGHQPTRAGSQNFRERIVDRPFLSKGDNSILGHGVTLLLGGSGGLITNPVTPPSSHRHPVSRIAQYVADRLDLRKDIEFNTTIKSAHFGEATDRWTITTDKGQVIDARFLVTCCGMLSAPLTSLFPGQETFKGQLFHTA